MIVPLMMELDDEDEDAEEEFTDPGALVDRWMRGDKEAIKTVEAVFASTEMTMDYIMARTLTRQLEQTERIERMIISVEQRRHEMLQQLDRHRTTFAQNLRRAVGEMETAEHSSIAPEQAAPAAPA